ncbi:MAG: hydroxyacylglutathione hydrolase [Nitrospirota bacterium]|jgi:hydroxyacylglutathione hydrolase
MLDVTPVPCLEDNYAYLLVDQESGRVGVVDAPEAEPIVAALENRGLRLNAILCTHHHWDHTGANEELAIHYGGVTITGFAGDRGRIPGQTHFLADGETFALGASRARVLHIPGHTHGAIAYHFADDGCLFPGDTLFGAGCGRLFEGTPEEMQASLARLRELAGDTRVYFGHEYTAANLAFARKVEPDSDALRRRWEEVRSLRTHGAPTCPSTLAEERATNPFLRWDAAAVIAAAQANGTTDPAPAAVFAAIRRWKDRV